LHALWPQARWPPHGCAAGITHVPALQVPMPTEPFPEQLAGQSALLQQPVLATQIICVAQFLGVLSAQVYPQLLPSQVAVAPAGGAHGMHSAPQCWVESLSTHVPLHICCVDEQPTGALAVHGAPGLQDVTSSPSEESTPSTPGLSNAASAPWLFAAGTVIASPPPPIVASVPSPVETLASNVALSRGGVDESLVPSPPEAALPGPSWSSLPRMALHPADPIPSAPKRPATAPILAIAFLMMLPSATASSLENSTATRCAICLCGAATTIPIPSAPRTHSNSSFSMMILP
jgi:hypothetical protein